MAVYYKFKSAKDYDSIPIDGHFISVATLKEKIYESKQLGRGTDYDLVVSNAQTNEEYLDEAMLIPKNTSVLIRRLPGRPRMPIVTAPVTDQDEPKVDTAYENAQSSKSSFLGADPSVPNNPFDLEYDEFGNDLYEIPEVTQAPSSNQVQDAPPPSKEDEDDKIRALIDTPALDWQRQTADGFGSGRGYGRGGMGGRMGGRGFGRGGGGLAQKTPPPGYVCYRCNKPGHFIQHCPTNGDPTYDVKRVKPPTGIPKSMLMATPDGSYALPSGAVAVLKPNEAAFEKEIEGMPSTRHVGELPPELHCPLCKQVMKDAVLTSKCCFKSFCDKCIRDHIISKSACVCGATNVLADDLLPNKTLRDTINRIMESNNDSAENGGSAFHVQDMESARCPPPKLPSPSLSAASKGEKAPAQREEITKVQENVEHDKTLDTQQLVEEKGKVHKVPNVSEATHESRSMKEPAASQGSIRPDEEVQQKQAPAEAAKKKKKKKTQLPMSAAEMQWRGSQDLAAEYMMPMGGMQQPYNPYWNGMQPGMEAFGGPFGGGPMPFMGYGPFDMPFGGMPPLDPFGGPGGYMMPPPFPPQRDLAEFAMMGMNGGMNVGGPPMMSREQFEARKAELKRKREFEMRGMNGGGRELIKDREFGREREREREVSSSTDISSMKSKHKSIPPPPSSRVDNHDYHRHRSDRPSPDRRSRDPEPPRPSSKRKSTDRHHDSYEYDDDHHHHHHHRHPSHRRSESSAIARPPSPPPPELKKSETVSSSAAADRKSKASVFSRISFPEEKALAAAAAAKRRKVTSSEAGAGGGSSSHHRDNKALSNGYHEEIHKTTTSSAAARKSSGAVVAAAVADVDEYESSDDDRHFKRRPAKERERDRGGREERDRSSGYSKHR